MPLTSFVSAWTNVTPAACRLLSGGTQQRRGIGSVRRRPRYRNGNREDAGRQGSCRRDGSRNVQEVLVGGGSGPPPMTNRVCSNAPGVQASSSSVKGTMISKKNGGGDKNSKVSELTRFYLLFLGVTVLLY